MEAKSGSYELLQKSLKITLKTYTVIINSYLQECSLHLHAYLNIEKLRLKTANQHSTNAY
uniref:Uncharacterized protein n=1 Tax=Tetranychus urticae TaxID=32264 RepID=T1KHY6_TETUR